MFETWHIISLIAVYLCVGLFWSRQLVWRRWSRLWYWCFYTVNQLTSHTMPLTYHDMLHKPVTPGTIGIHFIGWPVALLLIALMTAYFLLLLVLIYPCNKIGKLVLKKPSAAIAQCAK
jgi:hypothetical protein